MVGHSGAGYGSTFATAPDATGGALTLDVRDPRAVHSPVIDLVETADVLADALDIPWRGTFRHGFCWGLLIPDGDGARVVVMGHTAADLDGPGVEVGRLADVDARRFRELWGSRAVRVSVLIEATPGMLGLEVRYRSVPADPPAVPAPRPAEAEEVVDAAPEPADEVESEAALEPTDEVQPHVTPEPTDDAEPDAALEPTDEVQLHEAEPESAVEAEPEPLLEAPDEVEPEPALESVELVAVVADVVAQEPEPEPEPEREPEPAPAPDSVAVDPATLLPPGVPAGWYVDPFDADELRWWDGARWSADAAPRPAASADA